MEAAGQHIINCKGRTGEYTIWNLSDIHAGNKGCAKELLFSDIERIRKDPNALWVATGDLGEYIPASDTRHCFSVLDPEIFDLENQGNVGKTLTDVLYKWLSPIKKKCLGIGIGNHEWSFEKNQNQSKMQLCLADRLGARYLGYTALLDTVFRRTVKHWKAAGCRIRHLFCHGAGAAATPAGKLNRLLAYMGSFEADIYHIGHLHDETGKKDVVISANRKCNHIEQKVRLGVMSGSYLKTYAQGIVGYGERKGYKPTFLGASRVMIRPFDQKTVNGTKTENPYFYAEV